MRTTIDLPADLHRIATSLARDSSRSLSQTVADLMRRGLGTAGPVRVEVDPATGFPIVSTGVPITTEDVRLLDDET